MFVCLRTPEFPEFIWKALLLQASSATDRPPVIPHGKRLSSRGGRGHVVCYSSDRPRQSSRSVYGSECPWEELVGEDSSMRGGLAALLAMPAEEVVGLDMDFSGAVLGWDPVQARLALQEVGD